MSVFLHGISGVLIILIMIAVGFILTKRNWFDAKSARLLTRLVTQISLPAYMVVTITQKFQAHELLAIIPDLRFPVISMMLLMVLAMILVQVFQIRRSRRGLFTSMFFNSNTVFVGLPINQALFGDKAIPYILIYYMANTTIFWTLGVYLIQRDGKVDVTFDWKKTLGKIFSPPLLGFMLGVFLVLLHIQLPAFINQDLSYLGGLTIPLSMIFIGYSVANAGLGNLKLRRDNILIIMGRFVIAPILMTLLLWPTKLPLLMKQVFILQSAMPVMTNAPIIASLYDADVDYAAIMVTETTVLSLVIVPFLMFLTQYIQ